VAWQRGSAPAEATAVERAGKKGVSGAEAAVVEVGESAVAAAGR
jgi:hypothetical protein